MNIVPPPDTIKCYLKIYFLGGWPTDYITSTPNPEGKKDHNKL